MRNIFESASKIRSFGRNIKEYIVGFASCFLNFLPILLFFSVFESFFRNAELAESRLRLHFVCTSSTLRLRDSPYRKFFFAQVSGFEVGERVSVRLVVMEL